MSELTEYAENLAKSATPVLGFIVWYKLSDVLIPHSTMIQLTVQHQIDTRLPRPPEDSDVFRRVATANQRKRVPTGRPDVFENILVRDIPQPSDKPVMRQIVVEEVDSKGRRLTYLPYYEVTFERTGSVIQSRELVPGVTHAEAEKVIDGIRARFSQERGCLNTYAVREWIRSYIERKLLGCPVRDGVYYVNVRYAKEIANLEDFVAKIPGATRCASIPLADEEKHRDMVREAFQDESVLEIDRVVLEIDELLDNRQKITGKRYESLLNAYQELQTRTHQYSEILSDEMSQTNFRLKLLQEKIMQVLGLVK